MVENLIIFYVFFAENEIDEVAFKLLTSKEINEIIKSVGLRVKFKNKYYKIFPQRDPMLQVENKKPALEENDVKKWFEQ